MGTEETNRLALRAVVLGRRGEDSSKDESRALDPFSQYYNAADGVVQPPYDPLQMTMLLEKSDILRQVIDTLCTNIEGQGHQITSWDGEELDEKNEDVAADKVVANDFLNSGFDESIQACRESFREDLEMTGNTYLEVLRETATATVKRHRRAAKRSAAALRQAEQGDARRPWRINHLPSFLVRIAVQNKDDDKPQDAETYVRQNGEWVKVRLRRKFKKFVMLDTTGGWLGSGGSGERVYFKEFGDPRGLDFKTGRYYPSDKEVPKGFLATEIIHTRFKTGRSPYGISKYTGVLLNIGGARKANECNYLIFDNQGIPPMAVLVSGGHLTKETWSKVTQTFEDRKGIDHFHQLLIMEATSPEGSAADGDIDAPGKASTVKIELKPLTDAQIKDALFLNFLKFCHQVIRSVRRVPPVLIGLSEDDSYASAFVSIKTFEDQVCKGERLRFDAIINNLILPALGVSQWKFVSNGIKVGATSEIASLIAAALQAGVGDANEWAKVIGPLLGAQFADNPDLSGKPYDLIKAESTLGASLFSASAVASDEVEIGDMPAGKVADLVAARIIRTLERAHQATRRAADDAPEGARCA